MNALLLRSWKMFVQQDGSNEGAVHRTHARSPTVSTEPRQPEADLAQHGQRPPPPHSLPRTTHLAHTFSEHDRLCSMFNRQHSARHSGPYLRTPRVRLALPSKAAEGRSSGSLSDLCGSCGKQAEK